MTKSHRLPVLAIAATLLASACVTSPAFASSTPHPGQILPKTVPCPWATAHQLATKSPAQLATEVLSRMTKGEKISMLGLSNITSMNIENETPAIRELCLPAFTWRDGPAGVGGSATGTTVFPAEINTASSFDPALATSFGKALGAQSRAQGTMAIQGPGIDPTVYENWGRLFENFGSDPYLNATLGAAETAGIQSTRTIAVAKHYGPYAAENTRFIANYLATQRELQQVYLAPFRTDIAAGVSALMCSYGSLNGVQNCASPALVAQASKWGFTGAIRTDALALHNDVPGLQAGINLYKTLMPGQIPKALSDGQVTMAEVDAAVKGTLELMFKYHDVPAIAGTPTTPVVSPQATSIALQMAEEGSVLLKNDGTLPLATSGNSLAVISNTASSQPVYLGYGSSYVIGAPPVTPLAGIQAAFANSSVTYDAATPAYTTASIGTPQLINAAKGIYSAPVIVPAGTTGTVDFVLRSNSPAQLLLNNTPFFQSFSQTPVVTDATASQAVTLSAGDQVTLQWTKTVPTVKFAVVDGLISQAVAMAKEVSVPIIVASQQSTEGLDLSTLNLPGFQNQLISAVATANPRTIVVIAAGAPVLMPWINQVAGVLDTWYPGEVDGTAMAALLDGAVNPSGKLPIPFPTSDANAPEIDNHWPTSASTINLKAMGLNVGQHWFDVHHITPLFPYGYGLSYTTFSTSNLRVVPAKGGYTVSCTVTNTGSVTGRDVVQGYVNFPSGTGQPSNNLATYGSVTLAPATSTTLNMFMPATSLSQWSASAMRILKGKYVLNVGSSSAGPFLTSTMNVGASIPSYVTPPVYQPSPVISSGTPPPTTSTTTIPVTTTTPTTTIPDTTTTTPDTTTTLPPTTTTTAPPVPNTPANVTATNVPGIAFGFAPQITVTWTTPVDNGTPITGYEIDYTGNNGVSYTPATTSATGNSYTITSGLSAGTLYFVQVIALSAAGSSSPGLGPIGATASTTPSQTYHATLTGGYPATWITISAYATGVQTGGLPITGYNIERSSASVTSCATSCTWGPWSSPTTTTSPSLGNSTDTTPPMGGLSPNYEYRYRTQAVNGAGGGMWNDSGSKRG